MGRVSKLFHAALLSSGAALLLGLLWLLSVWPPPYWWRNHWPSRTAFMAMRERQYRAAGDTTPRRYHPVPLDSIADWLERAALTAEDDAFFSHRGIDWRALGEVAGYRRNGFSWLSAGDWWELLRAAGRAYGRRDRLRGASTITQQLAKNLYLSPSRNPLRKVKEAVIAYRLERELGKTRILELYLNVVELGPNLWGAEAASRRYFGRGAARLTTDQAAMLAATLPHPLTSNPAYRPSRARWRADLILRRLRGEPVEVPKEAAEDSLPPLPAPLAVDTLLRLDTLKLDSLRRDTISPPGAAASPDTYTTRSRPTPPARP